MPRTSQNILKQHDRRFTDLITLIEQKRLLKNTVLIYSQNIKKQMKSYYDWCKKNDVEPETIVLPDSDDVIV